MISPIIKRNDVIKVNQIYPDIDIHLTTEGSDWLWAAFSVFLLVFVIHLLSFCLNLYVYRKPKAVLFLVPIFINLVLAVCYFTYASNLGYKSTHVQFKHVDSPGGPNNRQVFYVKYIGWFLSWPLIYLMFFLAIENPDFAFENLGAFFIYLSSALINILACEAYVINLLIGIMIPSSWRWGYFGFSLISQILTISFIISRTLKSIRSSRDRRVPCFIVLFEVVVWLLYPLCWALSEGGNVMQPDSEAVFYGILDLITFCFVPCVLTWYSILHVDFLTLLKNPRIKDCNEKVVKNSRDSADSGNGTKDEQGNTSRELPKPAEFSLGAEP